MTDKVKCPICHGNGWVAIGYGEYYGTEKLKQCTTCDGSGKVDRKKKLEFESLGLFKGGK